MENKYYTPKLEEFHVGFKYEVMVPEGKLWSKEIFHLNQSHIDLVQYVDIQDEFTKNKIRVKYLEKQDFLDLGWIDGEPWGMSCFMLEDKKSKLGKLKKPLIQGPQIVFNSWECVEIYDKNHSFIFSIKNKSEFKVLLKQLNLG